MITPEVLYHEFPFQTFEIIQIIMIQFWIIHECIGIRIMIGDKRHPTTYEVVVDILHQFIDNKLLRVEHRDMFHNNEVILLCELEVLDFGIEEGDIGVDFEIVWIFPVISDIIYYINVSSITGR
jgi:hypothetical protein